VGRGQEHIRLTVADEAGNTQQVLWWNGGDQELPTGAFDLAYTLRTSDFKGQKQVAVELVDIRVMDDRPLTIDHRQKQLEVLDCRVADGGRWTVDGLQALIPKPQLPLTNYQLPITWAEAEHKKPVNGLGRHELVHAPTLVIWTTPPSRAVLAAALEIVKPEKVIVFAVAPGTDDAKVFLERLAGLVKFVRNQRAGQVSLAELAAATAQTESTVRLGLEWLEKRGQVRFQESGGQLSLTAGGPSDEKAAEAVSIRLSSNLEESAAFRQFFQKADLKTFFG
jgi:single-stranded-DNA-specific exonuclease